VSKRRFLVCLLVTSLLAIEGVHAEIVLQSIYQFPPAAYGANPQNRLLEGTPGTFYGTTYYGGAYSNGTIYKITSAGELTYLHSFDGTNGWRPWGALVWGDDGHLYGVARNNRTFNQPIADGVIFRCSTNGAFSQLFEFHGTNGSKPVGPLAKASDGSFYGTTALGGQYDCGTVFRVSTNGILKLLFSFNGANGKTPSYGLVFAGDGCFYGTTEIGGSNNVGTLFKLCDGQLTTLVHFGDPQGAYPVGGLTIGYDQNLYGATARAQGSEYDGTIFRVSNGVFSIVASFEWLEAWNPAGGIVQGKDGNLYGTMAYGSYLFRLTPDATFTPLFSFPGVKPQVFLTAASDGNLYGCLVDYERSSIVPPGMIFRLVEPPRITTLNVSNQNAALTWTSFTNGVYQVEHKASMESTNWTSRFPTVTATQTVSTFIDSPSGTAGYYRVVLLP
jgi:uncharacterized repeat protein (TIGR03803 family)